MENTGNQYINKINIPQDSVLYGYFHKNISLQQIKMADLILGHPQLLFVLQRFGIPLGFADLSISEVCRQERIPPVFFILVCVMHISKTYEPTTQDIQTVDVQTMTNYLMTSHLDFKQRILHIEEHLQHIVLACNPPYGALLHRFFAEYQKEVNIHFQYEEETIFPYLQDVSNHNFSPEFTIKSFRENHTNIEDKLSDLMNILIKYLPSNVFPQERIEISLDIVALSEDLRCHTRIEDLILIPFVEMLENANYENRK